LTYDYSWRWIFYINLPVGVLCTLGILVFIRQTRNVHREPFDFVGFLTLSLGIGALQLMLDRGELKDWFHSSEIWIEATVAGLGFYLFTVHTVTTDERSFLNRDLLKSANFVAGTLLMFCGGLIMTGTLALLPTMLQNLMYIDDGANADQRRELEAIFQGKGGGPMEIWGGLIAKWLPTQTAKIDVQQQGGTLNVIVGGFGQIKSQRLTNEAGQPTTMQNAGFATALQFDDLAAQLAPSDGTRWSDSDMPRQFAAKSGVVATFTWRVG
jgi:hypothetical protein